MSDPMNRNEPPLRDSAPPPVTPPPEQRKGSPLVWIVVLIALLALAWYFMSRRDTTPLPQSEPTAPIGQTDGQPAPPAGTAPRTEQRPSGTPSPARPVMADRDAIVANSVEPEYPIAAARARDEGTVLVTANVGVDGRPSDVAVARTSRSRDLDRAAVDAVKQWTFEPAIREGKSVASTVQVPVQFTLAER